MASACGSRPATMSSRWVAHTHAAISSLTDAPRYRARQGLLNVTEAQWLRGTLFGTWNADTNPLPRLHYKVPADAASATSVVALWAGATLHGVHIMYDWAAAAPTPIPPAVHVAGMTVRVTDVKIEGPWVGVSSLGTQNAGRFYLQNIFVVDAHGMGVAMGAAFDFSWMTNIEVWAPNSASAFANGTGILLNGIDGLEASGLGVFRYARAIHIVDQVPPNPVHGVWGTLSNVVTDFSVEGVVVTGGNTVTLSSCSMHSHETSLHVSGGVGGAGPQLRVSACDINSNGSPPLIVDAPGEAVVTVSGSGINRIFSSVDNVAVWLGGNMTNTITVTGCDIATSSGDAVHVEASATGVLMQANSVRVNVTENAMRPTAFRMSGRH